MSPFPLVAVAAEMNAVAARHSPQDMWVVARELDQWPDVTDHIALATRSYTQKLQAEYPINSVVVEKIFELFTAQQRLTAIAQEIGPLFRSVHVHDLRRGEDPRGPREDRWNV